MQLSEDAQHTPWQHTDQRQSCEQTAKKETVTHTHQLLSLREVCECLHAGEHSPTCYRKCTVPCIHICHSCVTSGNGEGSTAPAFVPNRKQTHKEHRRGGRGEEEEEEERRGEDGRRRWAKKEEMKRDGGRSEGSQRKTFVVLNPSSTVQLR